MYNGFNRGLIVGQAGPGLTLEEAVILLFSIAALGIYYYFKWRKKQ